MNYLLQSLYVFFRMNDVYTYKITFWHDVMTLNFCDFSKSVDQSLDNLPTALCTCISSCVLKRLPSVIHDSIMKISKSALPTLDFGHQKNESEQ